MDTPIARSIQEFVPGKQVTLAHLIAHPSDDLAKKIAKLIRDEYPKCRSQIQGDAIRVSSKSKDDLQRVIVRLREESEGYPVPLQFQNYR